ncbi:hypothetical protein [Geodermatophilus sp. SYSU D01119]
MSTATTPTVDDDEGPVVTGQDLVGPSPTGVVTAGDVGPAPATRAASGEGAASVHPVHRHPATA